MEEKRRLETKYERRKNGSDRREQTTTIQNFPHPRHFTVITPRPEISTLLQRAFCPFVPLFTNLMLFLSNQGCSIATHGSSRRGLVKQCDWGFMIQPSAFQAKLNAEKRNKTILLTAMRMYKQVYVAAMYVQASSNYVST